MGFFSVLGKIGSKIKTSIDNYNEQVEKEVSKLENISDDQLKRIFQSESFPTARKMAVTKILKSRGYGNNTEE